MRRSRSITFVLLASLFAVGGACGEATAPLGNGDDFINDTDGDDQATPQQGDDVAIDDVFARVDLGYGTAPDGYAPYDWCSRCACEAGTFCFGGGGTTTFSGTCAAGPPAGGGLAIGCMPYPPACAADAGCDCLIEAVQATTGITCAPVCSITDKIVYCPNP